jgi:uncharacterized coiled-coil protein SlyX
MQNLITTNFPSRDVLTQIINATIGGGSSNTIWGNHSTIGGGRFNTIRVTGGAPSFFLRGNGDCTIGGGSFNLLKDHSLESLTGATIGGGTSNVIAELANFAFIGGGERNLISYYGWNSVISGGANNSILPVGGIYCAIGGGRSNTIGGPTYGSAIGGGIQNRIIGPALYATIPGGENNEARGNHSFAAGRRAKANNDGAFVWADSTDSDFASTETNSFSVRAVGGVRFVSGIDDTGAPLAGVELPAGEGSWSSLSDRNAKENFAPVNSREVLDKLSQLPISKWNYKSQDDAIRHIGPTAQDFAAAFHVGEDERRITTIDADGVALAAIQGLNSLVSEQKQELQQLRRQNQDLTSRLEELEKLVRAVAGSGVAQK